MAKEETVRSHSDFVTDAAAEPGYDIDVTSSNLAAADARVSDARYAPPDLIGEFADPAPFGVALVTGDAGVVSYVNPAFRRLTGTEGQLVIDRPFAEIFPTLGAFLPQLRDLQQGGGPSREMYVVVPCAHGSIAPVGDRLALTAWMIGAGSPAHGEYHLVIHLQSASDKRLDQDRRLQMDAQVLEVNQRLIIAALREHELTERAEAANEAKSAFLATMSHELRTPLNAIIGYASLLDEGIWGPILDEQHRHLKRINTSARHLLSLIEEVLTLARMDADREIIRWESVGSESLLDQVTALTVPLAMEKQLPLVVHAPAQPFVVATDTGKAVQILVNLVGNAIKFTDRGEITLTAFIEDDEARFAVRDTGIGIDSTNLENIFEAFWQVEQTRTRRVGGSGLGLKLSRRLAQLLGGDLTVESAIREGSTFTLCLPLEASRDLL